MAVTDQQKLDFLLKKIGYTKTKTGSVVGTGAISGTGKQPFAEAIPSPLVVPNSSLWNEAASIPATAPGSDTTQVKVYLAASSGLRMTADATSSGQRAYIAYTTYNDTSSARLTNWIDTQFGASYLIKVYKGDPNSGGVALSAAGSGSSDGWFFDYSAGVLNFNDTSVPSGVTDTNIYIVGYRYIGQTGAPTSGISTFSYIDLTVERNLDVGVQGGISTFRNNIDLNADLDVDGHTNLDNVSIAGVTTIATNTTIGGNLTVNGTNTILNTTTYVQGGEGAAGILAIYADEGDDNADKFRLISNTDGTLNIDNYASGSWETNIKSVGNGAVELYFDNSKKIETYSQGVSVSGNLVATGTIYANTNLEINNIAPQIFLVDSNNDSDFAIQNNNGSFIVKDTTNSANRFTINSSGDATFSGNVAIGGTLTYEDVKNVDSVGIVTARAGINVTGGVITALAGENKIPSLYAAMGNLPSAGSYHGMFAHVHATGRGYFAHAGNWLELVNREINGVVGTGTETYTIGNLVSTSSTATSLNVTGVTTAVTLDVNGDLDVDGHTNLDNVSVAGVTTFGNDIKLLGDDREAQFGAGNDLAIKWDGSKGGVYTDEFRVKDRTNNVNMLAISKTGALRAYHNGSNRLDTTTAGIEVFGSVVATGADINGDLDVDGHTNLDNVNVAGVTTFAGAIDLNADLDIDGHTNLDNVSVAGVTTFSNTVHIGTGTTIESNGQATFTGITTFHDGVRLPNFYPGSIVGKIQIGDSNGYEIFHYNNNNYLTFTRDLLIRGDNIGRQIRIQPKISQEGIIVKPDAAVELYHNGTKRLETSSVGVSIPQDLDVDGHTNLDNVSIAGVVTATTFVGDGDFVELDVDGHTNLDNVSIAGVSTFSGKIGVHDGTTGANGQYLRATGAGVTWANFPTMRTGQTFTASAGQTTFSFTYNVGFLDVYVNGIKLSSSEFTATNGSSVVLAVGCFVGDIVELVSFFTTSYAAGSEGGGGLSNVVEDTSPQLGGNLDLFNKSITGTGNVNITGIISATSFKGPSGVTATFIGDGSGLTNVIGSGSGVVIKDDNNTVGTAGTINFAENLSVTPISAGIVTVGVTTSQFDVNKLDVSGISTFKGAVDINADIDVDGHTNLDNVSVSGVVTATTFVGAVTGNATGLSGNPSINITDLDVDGHTNLDNVSVAGVTTFTGAISASDIRSNALTLKNAAGSATYAIFTNGGSALLKHNNTDRLETSASGVTVTGTVAATAYTGDGSQLTGISGVSTANVRTNTLNVIGVSTLTNIDVDDFIDVGTNIQLGNAGVVTATTFVGAVTGNATGLSGNPSINVTDLGVDGHTNLDNVNIVGVTTTAGHILPQDDGAHDLGLTGTRWRNVYADNFVGDGSGLTGVVASGSGIVVKDDGTTVGTAGTVNFTEPITVTPLSAGITTVGINTSQFNVDKLNVSGISTFNTDVEFKGSGANILFDASQDQLEFSDSATLTFGNHATTGDYNISYVNGADFTILGMAGGSGDLVLGTFASGTTTKTLVSKRANNEIELYYGGNKKFETTNTGVTVTGTVTATAFAGDGSQLTGISGGGGANVGITTNLSGSFTASAGSAATINTFTGYSANDLVVEYTIYIKNGSDFQTQKLLAMRDGTTIHSTQFAVMFSSSLLVQCDATISSGNILLRATPETGVSGSTTYKIKREVM